jgi:hypothetical protein
MNRVTIFVTGVGTTLMVSVLAVGYLKSSLTKILIDLCGTEERASFWTAFSNVTLILVPLIFALHYHPETGPETSLVFEMGSQLEYALIGLVCSVVVLGIVLSIFIPGRPLGQ